MGRREQELQNGGYTSGTIRVPSTSTGEAAEKIETECGKGDTGWFPIKQIISRKGYGTQLKFLVEFMDGEKVWIPAKDVNLEAKTEFRKRMKDKGRVFRRKRKLY